VLQNHHKCLAIRNVAAEMRQLAGPGPELDFLSLAGLIGEVGDVRGRVSRWMKSGELIGIVRGIHVTAPEL
jgi:hypothetical protein